MFASDLRFSKAIMASRRAAASKGAPRRVYRLSADRPAPRQAGDRGR
jgi:hypothetical protein